MSSPTAGPATGPSTDVPNPTAREVLRDTYVRRYIAVQVASTIGVALHIAILAKQLWDITGSELSLGLLGLVEFAPAACLVLVTGSVADRFDRRKVAALGMAGQAVAMAALLFYSRTDPTSAWPLYVMAFVYGASRSFMSPATRSMPPMVAPEGGLPRTVALSSSMFTVAYIVGPAISGFLYAIDPWVGYAVALVLTIAGMVGVLTVRFRREPVRTTERPTLHSALEGLRFIRATPMLLAAISLDLFAVLFGGAVALLPAIADKRLGVGDVGYGWLRAAIGIGMGITAIAITLRPVQRHIGRVLLIVVGVFGAATVVLGLTRNYAVAFLALVVLSGADMVSMFIRSTLVPLITPDDKRGRVFAVEMLFIGASNELGGFESGVAAAFLGAAGAVVSGGVATMVVVALWWVFFPSLRDVDRFDDLEHARA
jgi:MFS family permease